MHKNPLGMAGIFHIFGNEVDSSSHMAGNVATDKLNGAGDFGTDDSATSNATTGDIQYFGKITKHFNQFDGNNRAVVFGPDIEYRPCDHGSHTEINLGTAEKPNWQSFNIKYDEIIQADEKLDIQGELDKLSEKSKDCANHQQTEGVSVKAGEIDLSNAQLKENEPIYVDVNADFISGSKKDITIKGIPAEADATAIVLNVKNIQGTDLTVQTHLILNYTDGSVVGGPNNTHSQFNKLLWNFGTSLTTLTLDNDYFLGSVLAPKSQIIANKNVDGNIIGDKVSVKGETHRWDWMMPAYPVVPDPQPKPEPTPDPQPEPKPQPNSTPNPDPEQPNFFPPTSKNPDDEPETPQFSEPKAKTPLPDVGTVTSNKSEINDEETFFQPQAKHHFGKAVLTDKKVKTTKTAKIVKTATSKTKVDRPVIKHVSVKKVAAPQVKKVATLPQTGEKEDHVTLLGLILVAASLLISFFGQAKKD